jgi:hypothetical protein
MLSITAIPSSDFEQLQLPQSFDARMPEPHRQRVLDPLTTSCVAVTYALPEHTVTSQHCS